MTMQTELATEEREIGGTAVFWMCKRLIDIVMSIVLMPLVFIFGLILLLLNPFFNKGPLIYTQSRFGRDLVPFTMFKFRTMTGKTKDSKFATAEQHRISKFAGFLRNTYIDEMPQLINVLRGDMSFLGPRPEQKRFVQEYLINIPSYKYRHSVRPGISGLAQIEMGYTDDANGAERKLSFDLEYIHNGGFATEIYIIRKTVWTIIKRFFSYDTPKRVVKTKEKTIA